MVFMSSRCAANLSPALGAVAARQKHTLPDLSYDYGALEPHINAEIMQPHHSKHHATYVNNLNITEEKYQEALAKGMIMVFTHKVDSLMEAMREHLTMDTRSIALTGGLSCDGVDRTVFFW